MAIATLENYTPMIRQYLEIKAAHPDSILFFRLGDFYEMFFNDAIVASKALDIQLTARDGGSDERIPMCGIPHHSAESYLKRLIHQGFKVAIAEQTEEASGQKLVRREVVRSITPGTHLDDEALETVLASLAISEHYFALGFVNITTGELWSSKMPKDWHALRQELDTHQVKEVLIQPPFEDALLKRFLEQAGFYLTLHKGRSIDPSLKRLTEALSSEFEKKNIERILDYLSETYRTTLLFIKPCITASLTSFLYLDGATIRHLELLKNERHQTENGSLFAFLNQTQTALGARFLKHQLIRPLKEAAPLNARYDTLQSLLNDFILKDDLNEALKSVYDLERITTKIALQSAGPKELSQLRTTLQASQIIAQRLESIQDQRLHSISASMPPIKSLLTLLEGLEEELPATLQDGKIFKSGYDQTLDNYREKIEHSDRIFESYLESAKKETGISKMKLGMNSVFGYYLEVPKSVAETLASLPGYTRKQTLANVERFISEPIKNEEKNILEAAEARIQREKELFEALIQTLQKEITAFQSLAACLSEIDFYQALATVAAVHQFNRPTLQASEVLIKGSFHPVVKAFTDSMFVENDITFDRSTDILLMTGPNMSGKSTYMRQFALLVILAQIGSFVPAKEAALPLFDQIFTRIGASDDLIRGQSTFMVEMLEAKRALDKATAHSLLLFDEMGRGTSTYDGLSLAWAMLEYIHQNIGAKTIFSTHYHELTQLEDRLKRLKNIHVDATKEEGQMRFSHQIKPGATSQSYGVEVAALAGLPASLIERAQTLLKSLEKSHPDTPLTLFDVSYESPIPEKSFFDKALETVDPDTLTPLEALHWLYEMKKKNPK
jgi:DNA mismatch repair protein MutS